MPCLTLLGTASIQDYVFRSNRLRENLGASGLVRWAMRWWGESRAAAPLLRACGGEVIFIGGGNAALRFGSENDAKKAVREWSARMLRQAPGLRLVVAHQPYSIGKLAQAFQDTQTKLSENENHPPLGMEPGALPVVRPCPSTGLAASELAARILNGEDDEETAEPPSESVEEDAPDEYDETVWLSAEAQAKRDYYHRFVRRSISERYRSALESGERPLSFPYDLGKLGTTAGASQIALVHADGNAIGKQFQQLGKQHREGKNDQNFIQELKGLSEDITRIGKRSFDRLVEELVAAIPELEKSEQVKLDTFRGRELLPLRPIVDEGDDLTFVCHGKLGISLAVRYLQLFAANGAARGLTASAGVVIMPQKFPFAQAYALCEDLSGEAKKEWRNKNGEGSWIDFHLQMEGRTGNLESFRKTLYPQWEKGKLPGRPFMIEGQGRNGWDSFQQAWELFSKCWPRSEAKRLFESYAAGAKGVEAVADRLTKRKFRALTMPAKEAATFDALEFLDFHLKWPSDSREGDHAPTQNLS